MYIYIWGYILVPIVVFMLLKYYRPINWVWLVLLIGGIFLNIAPFVALAYLVFFYITQNRAKPVSAGNAVNYNADGSYTLYKVDAADKAPSTGKVAFRVVGGILAGFCLIAGLLFIGLIIVIMTTKFTAPAGNGKEF